MKTRHLLLVGVLAASACTATVSALPIDAGPPALDPADAGHDAAADAGLPPATPDASTPDAGGPQSFALTVDGGQFVRADGSVLEVRGAISCCGGGYGWPLFDDAWVDLVAPRGVNALHLRLGPFRTEGNGETDWAAVGGGYVESGGQADLSRFNETFWARVRALLASARARGIYVEVDVIDGWALKHCLAGDLPGYSAWDSAFNVQQQNGCALPSGGAIVAGSLHDQWVRKVVAETGRFDNVLYQDGNEVGLVPGYQAAWTRSMQGVVRAEEQARGYVRHPFGTNSGLGAAMRLSEVDYLEFHQTQPATAAQCLGKPCLVNEYNPQPPLTSTGFKQRFCAARQQGTTFWYWRHDQAQTEMIASLDAMAQPCGSSADAGAGGCAFPQGVADADFIASATSYADTDPQVDATVNATMTQLAGCGVGSSCALTSFSGSNADQKCQSWFAAVTQALRAQGLCAGQHVVGSTDEIAVSNTGCGGKWYGYHVCNYGGPLVVWNPGARRGWWQIAPGACP